MKLKSAATKLIGLLVVVAVGLSATSCNKQDNTDVVGPRGTTSDSYSQVLARISDLYQSTANLLPKGAGLDNRRFSGGTTLITCDDNTTEEDPLVHYVSMRDVANTDFPTGDQIVALFGRRWRSWGFETVERPDRAMPNRFAQSPDGYRIRAMPSPQKGALPSLTASSPCFRAGSGWRRRGEVPDIIVSDGSGWRS